MASPPVEPKGGLILEVDRKGTGWRLGLRPGDVLLAVNGNRLRDVIDFQFFAADACLEFDLLREAEPLSLSGERRYGEPLGVEFSHPTFDVNIRPCNNRCDFCFVAQSPSGMRRSLYIKDDDYRYSFLFGHFVTLTNLAEEDWQRIEEQYLSPLYLSVQATDLVLRRKMLGNPKAPDILGQLRRLGECGVEVHTQLVLVPDLNDGPNLERSLDDLVNLFPTVQSVSVVPVGLTGCYQGAARSYSAREAAQILDLIRPWQARCRQELDLTLVYPSDEWYLLAERPIPPAAEYDGFGQIDNGVGVVRRFLEDWESAKVRIRRGELAGGPAKDKRTTLVSGRLAAPVVEDFAAEMNRLLDSRAHVLPVDNTWYGGGVTVTGLLTAQDAVRQIRQAAEVDEPGTVILPRGMFDNSGRVTLDDWTASQIEQAIGVPVVVADGPWEILLALVVPNSAPKGPPTGKPGWWGQENRPFWQVQDEDGESSG